MLSKANRIKFLKTKREICKWMKISRRELEADNVEEDLRCDIPVDSRYRWRCKERCSNGIMRPPQAVQAVFERFLLDSGGSGKNISKSSVDTAETHLKIPHDRWIYWQH